MLVAAACAAVACLAGCGEGSGGDGTTIRVLAAASLTDAFSELADAFEADHVEVDVELSFAASSTIREQVVAGAPADVLASADEPTMARLVEAGAVEGEPTAFASNSLEIAVPAGNPAGVRELADFARADLVLGLCVPDAPCGRLAREVLAGAGVEPTLDTEADDVRALLTQVSAGELDAGIVYRTDVRAAGDAVNGIPIPGDRNVGNVLLLATATDAGAPAVAAAFVDFARSRAGQAILVAHGFERP